MKFCKKCGKEVEDGATTCVHCGAALDESAKEPKAAEASEAGGEIPKSKVAAGVLGILLGAFGAHNLYLGKMNMGILQLSLGVGGLVFSFCTFGLTAFVTFGIGVWGLVEGIMILTGSINTDGKGNPLSD